MTVLSKIKRHSDAVGYFKELPFYNKPIEKPKVKRLKNIDQLAELPFHEQLIVIKTDQAFRGYAISHKVKIIEKKDPILQLEASKSSIKDLFSDILNETKRFKYNGFGWNVKSIESQYINISTCRSLAGSFYIDLTVE